jgi:hypothetical protein
MNPVLKLTLSDKSMYGAMGARIAGLMVPVGYPNSIYGPVMSFKRVVNEYETSWAMYLMDPAGNVTL